MAKFCKAAVLIFIVKFFCFSKPVMAELNEPLLYGFLSNILVDINSIKSRVEKIEHRMTDIEDKVSKYDSVLSKTMDTTDPAKIDSNEGMNDLALAITVKTLSSEKSILKEMVRDMKGQFVKLKLDVQKEMTNFKISVKEELEKETTAVGNLYNSVNNSILIISNNLSELKANLVVFNDEFDKVSKDIQSVNASIEENTKEIVSVKNYVSEAVKVKPRNKSSFSAQYASRLSNGVLVYDEVYHNEGSDFNNDTGTFTCRIPGLYFFIANVVHGSFRENYISCLIRRNSIGSVMIISKNGKDSANVFVKFSYGAASGAMTLHLSARDKVDVWCIDETAYVYFSSFTGLLIVEDT